MEIPLCRFGDIQIYRRKILAVTAKLVGMREKLVVESVVERPPGYTEIVNV